MCAEAERRYSISPRAAANIIGFCEFPVGWSWREYGKHLNERPQSYEKKAAQVRFLGTEFQTVQKPAGKLAGANAGAFRRRQVERLLNRMIVRSEIGVTIFDEHGQGHSPSAKLRLHPGSRIHVEEAAFGFKGCLWDCKIDAVDLTKLMHGQRWKDEREKNHDWLQIEGLIRNAFEAFGLPKTDQEVFDYILAIQAEVDETNHEPTNSTLRTLIADLRAEYEFYDYRHHL